MGTRVRAVLLIVGLILATVSPFRAQAQAQSRPSDDLILQHSIDLVFADRDQAREALSQLGALQDERLIHTLIMATRFSPVPTVEILSAMAEMTGVRDNEDWFDWMLWRERAAEPSAHPTFPDFQRAMFQGIDPRFGQFLPPGVDHDIRLQEIVWGGVRVDGIPALTNPTLLAPDEAAYLLPDDLVFGIEINGDARAYPLRILNWHEMFNDVIGGVPVSLAYCTLCGAGILFETTVEGYDEPFVFGSSGFLYRSNKLMYDQQTLSLWNQFTGEPVVGPLTGSGIALTVRPVAITAWAEWLDAHPDTRVLSIDTGHRRDYGSGVAYSAYFASPDLMFPAVLYDDTLAAKDHIFGIRTTAGAKAWPLEAFAGGAVINDTVGLIDVVLVGDEATRTVRAYRREGLSFAGLDLESDRMTADQQSWRITEDALEGDDGRRLPRVAGHVAYWFAWAGYLRDTELYAPGG